MRARRGEGEVMGRSRPGPLLLLLFGSMTDSEARPTDMEEKPPKVGPGKAASGTRFIGESGEEEGDGSESEDESVQDIVVVGDESADSDICVEVLS